MTYQLFTLADITDTGAYHGEGNLQKYQQQNFNTVIQTIGLCGNIYYNDSPTIVQTNRFGKLVHDCWYFEWNMEIEDLFKVDGDPLAKLSEVFKFVPYIPNLTEKSYYTLAVFLPDENIIFDYKRPFGLKDIGMDKY